MKMMQRTALMLALAIPATTLLAAETPAQDGSASHHPAAVPAAPAAASTASTAPMQAMRDRMRQMLQTQDPEKRKELMEAQMKDMETMMQGTKRSCPKADAKDGMGMMGGKCGKGMMDGKGGMGMAAQHDMMAKRMEMMEKRMDMMQMMMQMRMQGMGGGMGPGMGMPAN